MASFFQPAVYDPAAQISLAQTDTSRFLIYGNTTLFGSGILSTWYQIVVLVLGGTFFGLPILKWLVGGIRSSIRLRKLKRLRAREAEIEGTFNPKPTTLDTSFGKAEADNPGEPATTFGVFLGGDLHEFLSLDYDIHIVDYQTYMNRNKQIRIPQIRVEPPDLPASAKSEKTEKDPATKKRVWGLVRPADWHIISSAQPGLLDTNDEFRMHIASQELSGLVIPSNIARESLLNQVLETLANSGVRCILLDDSGEPSTTIYTDNLCGVIYRNACILPNGSRRDFFQASKLRTNLSHYGRARRKDPNFFVGFLDLWETIPLPAVIRRGYKFAKFHGAIFMHASAHAVTEQGGGKAPGNCLSAFDWLKRPEMIQAQKTVLDAPQVLRSGSVAHLWTPTPAASEFDVIALEQYIPGIISAFTPRPIEDDPNSIVGQEYTPPQYLEQAPPRIDMWTMSSQGRRLCAYGCYDLREELFDEQYGAVVNTQLHLQRLGMLEDLPEIQLDSICSAISSSEIPASAAKNLLLNLADGLASEQIKIFRGLDSGFCLPEGRGHFWAVSHDAGNGGLIIFTSLKTPDLITTVIHAYLAYRGVGRRDRFEIEMQVIPGADVQKDLHPRVAHELQSATYAELLHMIEQITVSGSQDFLLEPIVLECERLLIDVATERSWTKLHAQGFLSKAVSIDTVIKTRLAFFAKRGSRYLPSLAELCQLYWSIDAAILFALYTNDEAKLSILSSPLLSADGTKKSSFTENEDLYKLMFFCSLRRRAFEEVYMETTDRCPLFLQQRDQAAVFAELWVLGSQCEIYFGIKPRALGAIIYDEYREYLHLNMPSPEAWNGKDVFTAYHTVKVDEDKQILIGSETQESTTTMMPFRARLAKATFLTIFCVPAIVDVGLLTFLGRGLYLTAFMTLEERVMANYAVLAALIMTAGITGWSGSTGGFYLYQAAFHNMNHFMVQRFSGGFVLSVIVCVCGFVAFGLQYSWYGGFIFSAYLLALSNYLNILGIMATMHRDGAPFKSGRTALAYCLCITLISPLVSSFVNGHDVAIYLPVLYLFLFALLISYAKLCDEWSSWPAKVHLITEEQILTWYKTQASSIVHDAFQKPEDGESSKAQSVLASACLMTAIEQAQHKRIKKDSDPFVVKLAEGHKYVVWLLEKESNGQPLPPPYSSTWLVQTKLALTNQQQLNKGLKEHSPFLLYRNSKYDLAQNVGLFLVALLDRWIAISMSANGHVVNMYFNVRARYGIAFGLLYFLLCAVSLDVVLQRYWGKTGRRSAEKLGNILDFEATEDAESGVEKKRWLSAISELVWVMCCIFGFMTLLLWLFVNDSNQIILYFAYIIAYSGVIIFQFNRVFTTDIKIHVQIVFAAAFGGYLLGVVLHEIPTTQDFRYNDVVALCSASLSAAVGTWLYSDFCDDPAQEIHVNSEDLVNWKVYSQKLLGTDRPHCTMRSEHLQRTSGSECNFHDNSILSEGIQTLFAESIESIEHRSAPIHATFTKAREILEFTLNVWKHKQLRLIILDRRSLVGAGGAEVFAASSHIDGILSVYVGMPSMDSWRTISEEAYESLLIQVAAEALLHECCEAMLNMRHADATLAELLLNGESLLSTRMALQLAWSDNTELTSIIARTNAELIEHLSLGVKVNIDWENTPEDVRLAVVARVLGRRFPQTPALDAWLSSRHEDNLGIHDWYIKQCLSVRQVALSRTESQEPNEMTGQSFTTREHIWNSKHISRKVYGFASFRYAVSKVYMFLCLFIEFIAIVSTAGTDCGRELWYVLRGSFFRVPILWVILKIWKLCWWVKNFWTRILLLSKDAKFREYHGWAVNGASRVLNNGVLVVQDPRFIRTGFLAKGQSGVEMVIFDGVHAAVPTKHQRHQIASYDHAMRLTRLIDIRASPTDNPDHHYFNFGTDKKRSKYPISRTTQIGARIVSSYYDSMGRITHGECVKCNVPFQYVYTYKSRPAKSTQIIKASYTSIESDDAVVYSVYWCRETESGSGDIQEWTPTSRVQRFTQSTASIVQEVMWTYDHKRDPSISSTTFSRDLNQSMQRERLESFPDALGILEKPVSTSYEDEDILFYHSNTVIESDLAGSFNDRPSKANTVAVKSPSKIKSALRWLNTWRTKKHVVHHKLASSTIRSALWRDWVTRSDMNGVTTCLLDELILRKEPTLQRYWRLRDAGYFAKAKDHLLDRMEEVVDSIEIIDEISQKANLAIKPADLIVMGLSKDSNFVISKPEESFIDTDNRVAVIFTDTGCWPDAPGGVSNCRRDLVDGHHTVRNYALTESANEYGIPRFQVEKSLQMVKNLPLWGLDGKSPCHGLFDNLLQMQVESRIRRTRTQEDITETFIPLLKSIIRGARTHSFTQEDLFNYTNVFLNLNKYFDENDYLTTWRSREVRKAWREAWLVEYDDQNISNPNDSFEIERPTASDFDEALELYISYFFIFSVRVPDQVPQVYQSTHHGISSLFGMILKLRKGTTWGIWDHAIMWRESCLNISPAQCILPIAVQSMLLGAMKMAANLAYHHADIILPCTAIYNPIWEAELGTDQGQRSSHKWFERKIDPITNGISNMDAFKPVEVIRTEEPTVVMLSNVQFIKDVKNAILAAGVIINDFGFKKYNLMVYGAQDRQPSYAIETEELIGNLNIGKTVKLAGFGSPKEVLKDAWLFMNSSLSEGLPLAIGEAALSGIPIVATEVGATAQVLTDVDDPSILYGEVVPPNDPVALARAQISLLAMLGPWSKYTIDEVPPPPLPSIFMPEDVEWITARMYEKANDRRALGLKLRDVVLRKFNGQRYLREHEQMYWIQRHRSEQRANTRLTYLASSHPRFGQPATAKLVEADHGESMWLENRWQDFSKSKKRLITHHRNPSEDNLVPRKSWGSPRTDDSWPFPESKV